MLGKPGRGVICLPGLGGGGCICGQERVCAFLRSDSRIPWAKRRQSGRMREQPGSFEGPELEHAGPLMTEWGPSLWQTLVSL